MKPDTDRIAVSWLDTRVLTALLKGPMNSYSIARQCETDLGGGSNISNGALYPALKRLQCQIFIDKEEAGAYKLTPTGRVVIGWQINSLRRLSSVARERLRE